MVRPREGEPEEVAEMKARIAKLYDDLEAKCSFESGNTHTETMQRLTKNYALSIAMQKLHEASMFVTHGLTAHLFPPKQEPTTFPTTERDSPTPPGKPLEL